MILLVLSGLALLHPVLFFLTGLFGGGQPTRAVHPWLGVVLVISFGVLFVQVWRDNLWTPADLAWLRAARYVLSNDEEHMPEVGRYNAGQKLVFWAMTVLILMLFVTGLIIWDTYFFNFTGLRAKRLAVLLHSLAATAVIIVLIVHVYAAIWVRGSTEAMIRGYVTPGWAWRHHRRWMRELILARGTQGRKDAPSGSRQL
jgi:formate dehydrogenase subunit gamma